MKHQEQNCERNILARCAPTSVLTVLTLAAVGDKSLYEDVPQSHVDRISRDLIFTFTRVAGVHLNILNVGILRNSDCFYE